MPSPSSLFSPLPDPVHPARIGDVLIGPQPVKILASIMAPGTSDLIETACDYQRLEGDRSIDILEWRADFFESPGLNAFLAAALELRQCTEKPVVWTLRTRAEGGLAPDDESYREQVLGMAASGLVDAVDMELARGITAEDVALARQAQTRVILSYHNFEKTPSQEAMLEMLLAMDALGADVLKIAVMPRTPEDVLSLLSATCAARRRTGKPVISMSMGAWGALSRVSGAIFGSSAAFASVVHASAPGQFEVSRARTLMRELLQAS